MSQLLNDVFLLCYKVVEAEFVEIAFPGGVLPVTEEHLVFTADGSAAPAGSVQVGDLLPAGRVSNVLLLHIHSRNRM